MKTVSLDELASKIKLPMAAGISDVGVSHLWERYYSWKRCQVAVELIRSLTDRLREWYYIFVALILKDPHFLESAYSCLLIPLGWFEYGSSCGARSRCTGASAKPGESLGMCDLRINR